VPDSVRSFAERVTADPVAAGVWFLAGGSHNSVAIEMKDHIVVVETPLYDGRAPPCWPRRTRWCRASGAHGDQFAPPLRPCRRPARRGGVEGRTLVTSALARPWFEKTFANANRISPDLMAASGRSARITGVSGKHVISDGSRVIEVHEMQGSVHAQGFLMVWLPSRTPADRGRRLHPRPAGQPAVRRRPTPTTSTWCRTSNGWA
jgi:hypothetical protein